MEKMENLRSNQDIIYGLISAVREGNLEEARELILSFGLFYSQEWSQGYVLLCGALKNGHTAVAELLLTSVSKVNIKSEEPADTPLHFAVINGDVNIVKMILDNGADVDAKNEYAQTPLHVAAEIGYSQIAEHLLNSGADVNCACTGRKNYAPLHFAVERGHTEIVTLLLSRGAHVDAKGEDSITPLHIAAKNGSSDRYIRIAEDLLNHGACIHSPTLKKGYTPLHFASERDNEKAVELFLDRGADIHARTEDDSTSLHIATRRGCERIVKFLLQHGAKVDNQDKYGKTILQIASKKGNLTIVEDILKFCPDTNNQSNKSSLKISVMGRFEEESGAICEALLEYGFIIEPEDANHPELLHAAVKRGYLKIVEDLLKYGANVNCKDKNDNTPLHHSARKGNKDISLMLLDEGANVNAKRKNGMTPLHLAAREGHGEVVEVLLKNGAEVNSKMTYDMTPLHLSAKNNYPYIIETILKFGADIHSRDRDGKTALHIASENGYEDVVQILLHYGSDINITCKNNHTALDGMGSFHTVFSGSDSDDELHDDSLYIYFAECPHQYVAETLKRHIVKMKIADLYVCKENLLPMNDSHEMSDFQNDCQKEILRMKNKKISNCNCSFYDILSKDTNSLAMYMGNENVVQVLESNDYKLEFPIYASMIENNFRKAIKRKKLLREGNKSFYSLSNELPQLPYDCAERIISSLSDEDLRNLIDACKPLGISNRNTNIN